MKERKGTHINVSGFKTLKGNDSVAFKNVGLEINGDHIGDLCFKLNKGKNGKNSFITMTAKVFHDDPKELENLSNSIVSHLKNGENIDAGRCWNILMGVELNYFKENYVRKDAPAEIADTEVKESEDL